MNEKPDMMINIYGGNNLIAPVASSAIQNFYGDRGDEAADQPEDSEKTESTESVTDEKPAQEPAELSDDEFYVSVYIPDIKVMRAYKILSGQSNPSLNTSTFTSTSIFPCLNSSTIRLRSIAGVLLSTATAFTPRLL